ncbi:MAG: ATP-dependent endonuclease [Bacteroidales bacterium]|nr:ATP-dependent endonuclease [Bacteroidales bacterium]
MVEGDSDELVIQKAFMVNNKGKLPIEGGIDIISVGTAFLRFLEIAEKINKNVVVVTDNDGNIDALKKNYKNYLGSNSKGFIKTYYDESVGFGELEKFNYNTLEPKNIEG